jgi:hypothetical protein
MIFVFAIFWYAFLGGMVYLFQKHTKCFSTWNTFTLFLALALLSHGINVPISLGINRDLGVNVTDEQLFDFIANLMLMYVCILIGIQAVNKAFGFVPRSTFKPEPRLGINPLTFWPLVVLFVLLLIYKLHNATIQLDLQAFLTRSLSPEEFRAARFLFGKSTASQSNFLFYLANLAAFAFFPFILFVFYFAKGIKKNRIYKIGFWVVLALIMYHGLVSGKKAAAVMIVIGLYICNMLRKNELSFIKSLKLPVVFTVLVFFVFMPFLYKVQFSHLSYLEALNSAWFRLTIEPNRVLQLYYHAYPNEHDFMLGSSAQLVANFAGVGVLPPHSFIPKIMFGQWRTTWNAIFIGDAWADFGYWGTIIYSVIVGFLLQLYNVWFSFSRKTVLVRATYVALIVGSFRLALAGLFTSLLTFGVLSVFVLYLFSKELTWLEDRDV